MVSVKNVSKFKIHSNDAVPGGSYIFKMISTDKIIIIKLHNYLNIFGTIIRTLKDKA